MMLINIANLTSHKVPKKVITKTIKKIITRLRREKNFSFLENVELSIAFIKEGEMKRINSKYRKINKPTDELSFLLKKSKNKLSGEILLCPKVIKTKDCGFQVSSFKFQVNRLLTHAFLHLCGFDHETDKDWKKMDKVEKIIAN